MGNRAVLDFGNGTGIYLHWNGGRESVQAFLRAAKDLGVRENDPSYNYARIVQIIGNFFGGTLSVGAGQLSELDCDNGDNGVFKVKGFEIVSGAPCQTANPKEYEDGVYDECMRKNAELFVVKYPKEVA